MQSKLAFFPSTSRFSIDDFDSYFRKLVLDAYEKRFNSVADARLYLALCGVDLESTVKIFLAMKNSGMLHVPVSEAIFAPVGCGDIANAFCKIMTSDPMITGKGEFFSINQLMGAIKKELPKIIRIDIPGHSYVMLACDITEEGVMGYIYQSNVAYGMEDNSFSLAAWLMDARSGKTNLSEHLYKLSRLLQPGVSNSEKGSIYLELYCANPIIEVKTPANIQEIISYINENISFKYRIKPVRAIDMMYASERLKRIVTQHPEEQEQSLETYMSRMQIELEEYDRLEYQPT